MPDRISLIETIANEDKFASFARLLNSSKAKEIFNGAGSFTVFAPTNDAFKKIPEAEMKALLSETDQVKLKALLSYHVMPGRLLAANVASLTTAKSVTGEELTFADKSGIKINGSNMQARNMEATNGVVHAIDTVLTPPAAAVAAKAAASSDAVTQPLL